MSCRSKIERGDSHSLAALARQESPQELQVLGCDVLSLGRSLYGSASFSAQAVYRVSPEDRQEVSAIRHCRQERP